MKNKNYGNTSSNFAKSIFFWFLEILCKGTGQVMFQDNAWTGLFFLAGIFYGSYVTGNPAVAWGALAGVFMSTITGYLLRYPAEKGTAGLWDSTGFWSDVPYRHF